MQFLHVEKFRRIIWRRRYVNDVVQLFLSWLVWIYFLPFGKEDTLSTSLKIIRFVLQIHLQIYFLIVVLRQALA